jgi:hypothetical protein
MESQFKLIVAIFLLGFLLLPVSPATPAEIYKWKDKDGNVFYSDTPPSTGMDTEMKTFKEGSPPAQKKPEVSSPLPMGEIAKEKRPYSSINVTLYMTSW